MLREMDGPVQVPGTRGRTTDEPPATSKPSRHAGKQRRARGRDDHFNLRRWKFERWFAGTCLGDPAKMVARTADGQYVDTRAALAWQAWQEAVNSITDIPREWELSLEKNSRLGYEFKWLFGIETAAELARSLAHEPRLFEMALGQGYIRLK